MKRRAAIDSAKVDLQDGTLTIPYSGKSGLKVEINLPMEK